MSKPVCYMLVGLPGSGKTTWAQKNFTDLPIVGTDHWVEQLARSQGLTYTQAFSQVIDQATRLFDQQISDLIWQRQSFVWDQTNITMSTRRNKLMKLRGYSVIAHAWQIDDLELQRRQSLRPDKTIPDTVLENMRSMYSIPTPDHGFDQVVIHRE